ncbi:dTMP kinase [Deinococcus soli (ex Cha et al. 2016)]|uniref:Thymidylate kinase n=2 Tax=Deinococcus soli (ex Cha et al. 2016) TaxID=1309411 RepID=A0AAE4BKT6_9DEIO|nr:dTMP kinase [Deinococcus soli (ex Cha et al. 2016)]MDR6218148.1 energy-coupling factor transporter ATP-binding protein EcfA2 [Deinococcus soli (ex Cha et al. 2016)]MDR6328888.1 energy-coupling factor transporter ATP-binding protein EcfA2 [Deinococcus soli (ex Cha et al. 2016)]MDR6751624.1 energy-coupling factor transporter ATP-binding protein EcfA2 [Deinococcus soli (ex Cha et al. 2016)]
MQTPHAHPTSTFIILEGPDGSGKTSTASALCDLLRHKGRQVLRVREPGSTSLGQELRQIALDAKRSSGNPHTIALLMQAARVESYLMVDTWLSTHPRGTVISERSWPSTVAYQGSAIGHDAALELTRFGLGLHLYAHLSRARHQLALLFGPRRPFFEDAIDSTVDHDAVEAYYRSLIPEAHAVSDRNHPDVFPLTPTQRAAALAQQLELI